jgi:hypothetical protein
VGASMAVKPMYQKFHLTDLHFALFGCKIAQGLTELHLYLSPVAAAFAAGLWRRCGAAMGSNFTHPLKNSNVKTLKLVQIKSFFSAILHNIMKNYSTPLEVGIIFVELFLFFNGGPIQLFCVTCQKLCKVIPKKTDELFSSKKYN